MTSLVLIQKGVCNMCGVNRITRYSKTGRCRACIGQIRSLNRRSEGFTSFHKKNSFPSERLHDNLKGGNKT